ncbi:MAG: hypothetical protein IJ730_04865 [Alphaproteobacteria bacterium]|nr:hypothetical protein [Alphaproteobacteria bacterium]
MMSTRMLKTCAILAVIIGYTGVEAAEPAPEAHLQSIERTLNCKLKASIYIYFSDAEKGEVDLFDDSNNPKVTSVNFKAQTNLIGITPKVKMELDEDGVYGFQDGLLLIKKKADGSAVGDGKEIKCEVKVAGTMGGKVGFTQGPDGIQTGNLPPTKNDDYQIVITPHWDKNVNEVAEYKTGTIKFSLMAK